MSNLRRSSSKTTGFTLIEIMIALAIFAVVSAALVRNASLTVYQTCMIRERTLAWWVADNHLSEMRSAPRTAKNYPSVGRDRVSVNMAGRDWELAVEIKATENENMRRIEITAYNENDLEAALMTLSGFLGRY
jgi:general secretion pathway protein I